MCREKAKPRGCVSHHGGLWGGGVSRILTSLGSVLPADFGYGKKIKDWLKKNTLLKDSDLINLNLTSWGPEWIAWLLWVSECVSLLYHTNWPVSLLRFASLQVCISFSWWLIIASHFFGSFYFWWHRFVCTSPLTCLSSSPIPSNILFQHLLQKTENKPKYLKSMSLMLNYFIFHILMLIFPCYGRITINPNIQSLEVNSKWL